MNTRQWEYRVVTTKSNWRPVQDNELQSVLNKLGKRGWEAVSVSPYPGSGGTRFVLTLKRPLRRGSLKRRLGIESNGKKSAAISPTN